MTNLKIIWLPIKGMVVAPIVAPMVNKLIHFPLILVTLSLNETPEGKIVAFPRPKIKVPIHRGYSDAIANRIDPKAINPKSTAIKDIGDMRLDIGIPENRPAPKPTQNNELSKEAFL